MIPYVVTPQSGQISVPVPSEYIGKPIRVFISLDTETTVTEEKNKLKLSERLYGSLSEERTNELQKELIKMRNEWDRDIY